MNSRTTAGDKKTAFVLKEFQPAKPKSGYDIAAANPLASLIYEPSSFDAAGDMNGPAGLTGLIHHDDYKRLKADVANNRIDRTASPTPDPAEQEARRKKLEKLHKKRKSKLSFAFDEDGDEISEGGTTSAYDSSAKPSRAASVLDVDSEEQSAVKPGKRAKLGKDPSVNTSFLPDREREEAERIENEKKLAEWRKRQAEIKAETVDIQFAYYDGLSHLGSVTVKKGEAIFNLIDKAKKAFPAIRDIPADRLLFAKDDIIIPHEMSLYYFEANQVKGKYGLLFEFHDPENQGRLRNKNDVRLGKLVTRKYADNSKHIFPFARWELFDPEKDYTKKEDFKF